jgi:hypothetical protein
MNKDQVKDKIAVAILMLFAIALALLLIAGVVRVFGLPVAMGLIVSYLAVCWAFSEVIK